MDAKDVAAHIVQLDDVKRHQFLRAVIVELGELQSAAGLVCHLTGFLWQAVQQYELMERSREPS